jgi:hypothetical protein
MALPSWQVAGQYLESCNCDPICPCRMSGGVPGGRSTHGECYGLLSWHIEAGTFDGTSLDGLNVALAVRYHDDEPGSPWTVVLYVDEAGNVEQRGALAAIFLGRAGGERILRLPWVRKESFLIEIRPARIGIDADGVEVDGRAHIRATRPFPEQDDVRCVIPGYEEPGLELIADELAVHDDPFDYELAGNCAYRSEFHYAS